MSPPPHGREARDHGGKLLQHLRPAELGAPEGLFDPRLGDVEARMLEEEARPLALALALRLEPEAHLSTDESATRTRAGWAVRTPTPRSAPRALRNSLSGSAAPGR